jgi:glycosyltransferase involved in cell wall biosynthesis
VKRVLLVQPSLQPPGGGNGVAAWILAALKDEHAVTVLTWEPIALEAINRFYGTRLRESDFAAVRVHPWLRRLLKLTRLPLGLLRTSLLLRACKQRQRDFDLCISANNECDFGRPGIQYVHFPWAYQERPAVDLRWYHLPSLVRAYYALCIGIAGFSFERMARNLTLVNSDWTGRKVTERHGIPTTTLYPALAAEFPDVPWSERENGFVCVGRISPEKELEKVIDIVGAVRAAGADTHLHVAGTPDDPKYTERIRRLARAHPGWLFLEEKTARDDLLRLIARHRYGIHGMSEEHFGMAIAEMVEAGCVVFVPRGGGQVEIVGGDERLTFATRAEAVEKILRVMNDSEEERQLRAFLATRKELFAPARFVTRIREIARSFPGAAPSG